MTHTREQDLSDLFERRTQLIHIESFLLILALLSQLAFMFWRGFGERSFTTASEFLKDPVLWAVLAANLICWGIIFAVRFLWQGFDHQANSDPQTGLFHRFHFEKLLDTEIRRAGRYHYPATLCMIDLDRFAALNESHGRSRGDETLQRFAGFLRASARITDLIARYEKDEFCILLPHTDLVRAEKFIARILAQSQERLDCSFSAGLTAFYAGEARSQFWGRAALALGQAKQEGTGKIRCLISGTDSRAVLSF